MKIRFYDWQMEAIGVICQALATNKEALLVAATGSGKTLCSLGVATAQNAKSVLFVTPRRNLVKQTIKSAENFFKDLTVFVGTVKSCENKINDGGDFDLVICDECHHSAANEYTKIIEMAKKSGASVLGLTATPIRLDGKSLEPLFGEVTYSLPVLKSTYEGTVVPFYAYNLSNGDGIIHCYEKPGKKGFSSTSRQAMIDAIEIIKEGNRKSIVFFDTIEEGNIFLEMCKENNLRAMAFNSKVRATDREEIIEAYMTNEIDILVGCQALTEGFDCPAVNTVVSFMKTASAAKLTQAIGRGLRKAENKKSCDVFMADTGSKTSISDILFPDAPEKFRKNISKKLLYEHKSSLGIANEYKMLVA